MTHRFADITFTDSVKAAQERYGSRQQNARLQNDWGPNDKLTSKEIEFIEQRDSFYLATVNEEGWPYVQHRGGPTGFLSVLGEAELTYADFRGNKQLISAGNLTNNNRCSLILMDYANRRRLKILGRMRMQDSNGSGIGQTTKRSLGDYKATVERTVFIDVVAFDWNCPQHITPRYTETEFAQYQDQD
jgi:predicted pyridoxine 5'-phosphate oxidase superfamily flavin-nucleotide-binding protein